MIRKCHRTRYEPGDRIFFSILVTIGVYIVVQWHQLIKVNGFQALTATSLTTTSCSTKGGSRALPFQRTTHRFHFLLLLRTTLQQHSSIPTSCDIRQRRSTNSLASNRNTIAATCTISISNSTQQLQRYLQKDDVIIVRPENATPKGSSIHSDQFYSIVSSSTRTGSRREIAQKILFTIAFTVPILFHSTQQQQVVHAAETIGKDPNCNDSSCLGVWDGLLANCPNPASSSNRGGSIFRNSVSGVGAGCVSSQDDTPGVFAEPWDYSDDEEVVTMFTSKRSNGTNSNNHYDDDEYITNQLMDRLIEAIQVVVSSTTKNTRGDDRSTVEVLVREGRYLRVLFLDGREKQQRQQQQSIGEFYFTPNDTTVQFRIADISSLTSFTAVSSSKLHNIDRAEMIRKQLRFMKLPVLRNRKRSFLFLESDQFDRFGPGSSSIGSPADMKKVDLDGIEFKNF